MKLWVQGMEELVSHEAPAPRGHSTLTSKKASSTSKSFLEARNFAKKSELVIEGLGLVFLGHFRGIGPQAALSRPHTFGCARASLLGHSGFKGAGLLRLEDSSDPLSSLQGFRVSGFRVSGFQGSGFQGL